MAEHKHEWLLHSRVLDEDGTPLAVEVCPHEDCGEKRERRMTKDEAADYAAWREQAADLARTGPGQVVGEAVDDS